MRILIGSAEIHPYSKTGGLADMVAAIAKFLARSGHRVGVVTPLYRGVRQRFDEIRPFDWQINLPLGQRALYARLWVAEPERNETIYFVEQPSFYEREDLYKSAAGVDFPDNAERFLFLSKCVAQVARFLPWQPEIVHLHDWHVAAAALIIRHEQWHDGWFTAPKSLVTVHNLAYQGASPVDRFGLLNLPWYYFNADGAEFHGGFNPLKTGLAFAEALSTVSPNYAREILTPEFGCGLDGLLQSRQNVLTGILNGVDYEEWRTSGNPHLAAAYTAEQLEGKLANKLALQRELGLPERPDVPLFGTVTRMEEQKGVDLILGALEEMQAADLQYVVLGTGRRDFASAFTSLAHRRPDKVAAHIGYDSGLAHRIEAGCDFYLMPSRFEPCGLNQMYSLRYGAVPIVRATGGLDDSVIDVREAADSADGIKFHEPSAPALAKAIRKALVLYQTPDLLSHYRRNGMAKDLSWQRSVQAYQEVYARLLGHGG